MVLCAGGSAPSNPGESIETPEFLVQAMLSAGTGTRMATELQVTATIVYQPASTQINRTEPLHFCAVPSALDRKPESSFRYHLRAK